MAETTLYILTLDYYNMFALTPEMLAEADWDDMTVQMAHRFCFLNPAITTESLELLEEYAKSLQPGWQVKKGIKAVAKTLLGEDSFRLTVEVLGWLMLACLVALILKKERCGWHWAALGLNAALCAACLLYLGMQGRLPLRALRTVLLPMAAAIIGLLPACLPQKLRGKSIGLICLTLCVAWTGWYLAETIPGLRCKDESEPVVCNAGEALDAYALSEPDMLFIYDVTLVDDMRMFPDTSEGIPTNVVFWGGWGFRSEANHQRFAAFGIDLDHFDADMWLQDNVCLASLVLDPPAEMMMDYLRRELDPEIDCVLYGEDSGVYYYQFY